jgi:hypothetical protein
MNQVQEKEYPGCNKCGMHKLKVDNVLKCPNCDTVSVPSGLVSRTKDPGVGGFVKKTITGTDGKTYEIMVAADTESAPEVSQQLPEAAPGLSRIPITIPVVPADATIPQMVDEVKARPELLLKALKLVFDQHPARTMAEFKRLKKVRDQIDKLEFLIQNIKGE